MSYVICENCKQENILYNNEIEKFSKDSQIQVIGKIPLEKEIIRCCEAGTPSCIKFPESSFSKVYCSVAKGIIKYLDEIDEIRANKKK
jgi:ATP-binding protein involved in chromosome partitioning